MKDYSSRSCGETFGLFFLCLAAVISSLAQHSYAAKLVRTQAHPTPVPTNAAPQIRLVEEFEKLLSGQSVKITSTDKRNKKQAHRQSLPVNRAFEALEKELLPKAIYLASIAQKGRVLPDYGNWIAATAYLEKASKDFEKKRYLDALHSAKKASSLILQLESEYPFSPFIRDVPTLLLQSDRWIANASCASRKWVECKAAFERTLYRLQSQKDLSSLEAEDLNRYAGACQKSPTSFCFDWLGKLSTEYVKRAKDFQGAIDIYHDLSRRGYGVKLNLPESPYSKKIVKSYKAPDLDQAAFEESLKLYFTDKFSDASKGFRKFLEEYPYSTHRIRAQYWLGQALKKNGELEEAKKIFSEIQEATALSFYGILASAETSTPLDSLIPNRSPMAFDDDPNLSPIERFHLGRAKILLGTTTPMLAVHELKEISPRSTFSSYFLVYLVAVNQVVKNYSTSFQALSELIQRKFDGIISSFGLRTIFPVEFFETIKRVSTHSELDPILVLSLIKQESAFNERAASSAGALGLMQLMPFTAADMEPNISRIELLNSEKNIQVGSKYLKRLLHRYHGNIAYSLAAYNAGPTATDRWIKETASRYGEGEKKGDPSTQSFSALMKFIETISYRETREYVSGIIRNYFWYTRKLSGAFPKGWDTFWKVPNPESSPLPGVAQAAKAQT